MITADELIDGAALAETMQSLGDSLIAVILAIISGVFEVFFIWLNAVLTGGILGDNPAILLIGIALFITAFIVWRGRQ